MASQGPNNPGTASGVGWGNQAGIETNTTPATWTTTWGNDDTTYALIGTNFGFSIPAGATINGIQVVFARQRETGTLYGANTITCALIKGGSTAGSTHGPSSNWTLSLADESYGTTSDLWGTTWTPAQVNASNFGFQIIVNSDFSAGSSGSRTCAVQNYRITVTYTLPAMPSPVSMTMAAGTVTAAGDGNVSTSGENFAWSLNNTAFGSLASVASPAGVLFTLSKNDAAPLFTWELDYGNVVAGSAALPSSVNATYFYARFIGFLIPSITGLYTVGANYSGGMNMYIAGHPIISDLLSTRTPSGVIAYTSSSTILLTAGVWYPLVAEWAEGTGASYECQLLWTPPGEGIQLVNMANVSSQSSKVLNGISDQKLHSTWWNGNATQWFPNLWHA